MRKQERLARKRKAEEAKIDAKRQNVGRKAKPFPKPHWLSAP